MKFIHIVILSTVLLGAYSCTNRRDAGTAAQEEEHHHEIESNLVSLTEAQIKSVNIELGALEQKNIGTSIKVNGKLEVPAQNKAMVTSLYEGVLQTLLVHPGSEVRKGQVIATIANTELSGLQQSLLSVNAQLKLAQLEYNRQQELVEGNAAPAKNLQRAQAELSSLRAQQAALKKQLATLGIASSSVNSGNISSTLTLTAPISGTISDIHAQIGSKVDLSTPVATIVNNSQLHLDLFVYEKHLPLVQKGQVIHFTLTNSPGKEYDARIFSIGTAFADESKAVPVHAEVEGNKAGLIEGMSVTAIISIGNRTAPAIPSEAIVTNGGKDYIFVQTNTAEEEHGQEHNAGEHEKEGRGHVVVFERIQVVKGATDLGYTEIQPVTALPADAKIVVRGAFFVLAKMTNAGEAHAH